VLEKLTVTVKGPAEKSVQQRLDFRGHVPPRSSELDGFTYQLKNNSGTSNGYLLTYARAPIVLDNGENETAETAQQVTLPCEIGGWIEKLRDRDWYRFEARKGETYTIEVYGDRLGSAVDMYFTLKAAGKTGTSQEYDDNLEILHQAQFFTRTEDPARVRFQPPADGEYLLQVTSRDADLQASPRQLYRVRITPEQPDFRLIVMPASTNTPTATVLHAGGMQYFTVLVWRQDGFDGSITLSAEGLPAGVTCPPQVVGPGIKQAGLVLTAAPDAAPWTGSIKVRGTAIIDEEPVVRDARPASITWAIPFQQQNTPAISRVDQNLVLAVREKALFALTVDQPRITLQPGEKANVTLRLQRLEQDFKAPVQVTAVGLPPGNNGTITFNGNNNQPLTLNTGKDEASVVLDVKNGALPGVYTIVLRAACTIQYSKDPAIKQKTNVFFTQGSLPITLEIPSKPLASVTVTPSDVTVAKGKSKDVMVKVGRPKEFKGEYKVILFVPDDAKGVRAEDVTIPADKDEAKLTIQAAQDAGSGARTGVKVRVFAQVKGKVVATQDAKVNVTVTK
jgi:hypothetical protein